MNADNIEITDENREEVLERIYDNPVFQGKVTDWESFVHHPKVKAAYKDMRNPNAVIRAFAFNPPKSDPKAESKVPAFWLQDRQFNDYDEDNEEWYLDAEGPTVLAADGIHLRTKRSSDPRVVRTIARDPEVATLLEDDVEGPLEGGKVVLDSVLVRQNILTGEIEATILDETDVRPAEHDGEVPSAGIEQHINYCMTPMTYGQNARGVVRGDTGDSQVFAVGTIGDEEEVDFAYEDESIVEVICYDHDNYRFKTKIPTEQVAETFGLGEDPDIGTIKTMCAHEPLALFGRFGPTWDVVVPNIDDDGVRDRVETDIQTYVENDWMVKYDETDDDEPLLGIDFSDELEEDEDGNPLPHSVNIGPYDAYDVFQEEENGEIVWKVKVYAYDEDSQPWMHARESHFTYKKDIPSMGIKAGDPGVSNEGAFIIFLNHVGSGVRLRDDDPFSGKFDDLPGFDELERELEAEEDTDEDVETLSTEDIL